MVIGMKSGEPPYRGNIMQRERELIAALKDVQSRVVIPLVIQRQTNLFVRSLDCAAVFGTVDDSDQVQFIGCVRGYVYQAVGLGARRLIPADHIEIDNGSCCLERPQRMRRVVVRAEQSAFFSGEDRE